MSTEPSCIGNFVGALSNGVIGVLMGETLALRDAGLTVIGGIFAHAFANICWRSANLLTDNLGINALAYGIPILSLTWLFLFAEVNVPRIDFLIIGAAAIITANLLINFEAEIGFGFKSLILALWGCGAVVYLRPEQWIWNSVGYFQVLGLSATVFTLILAFRVARLVGRTSYEDNATFSISRNLDLLARRGIMVDESLHKMLLLDSAPNVEDISAAYGNVKQDLQAAHANAHTPTTNSCSATLRRPSMHWFTPSSRATISESSSR